MNEHPTPSGFAQRLAALRALRNLNQVQLAEKSGIGRSTINRHEADENDPSMTTLVGLARALGCTIDYLAGLAAEPERLPPERWLIDQVLYDRVMRGEHVDLENEHLGFPIPAGAAIADSTAYHRMLQEMRTAAKRKRHK